MGTTNDGIIGRINDGQHHGALAADWRVFPNAHDLGELLADGQVAGGMDCPPVAGRSGAGPANLNALVTGETGGGKTYAFGPGSDAPRHTRDRVGSVTDYTGDPATSTSDRG